MFEIDKYKEKLKNDIGKKRFAHCLRVVDFALKLNENLDEDKVKASALLHDCAKYNEEYFIKKYKDDIDLSKEILENKAVLHSFLGKIVAKKEYNINDEEVLNAIKYHTTGRANMTELEKIVFLADRSEERR